LLLEWPLTQIMNIIKTDGTIEFEKASFFVKPALTKNEFISSRIGSNSRLILSNSEYSSFSVSLSDTAGDLGVSLRFDGQQIDSLGIEKMDATKNWNNWSEMAEQDKKSEYDQLLVNILGSPPYVFEWGEITSSFDPRSGSSSICIRYNRKSSQNKN